MLHKTGMKRAMTSNKDGSSGTASLTSLSYYSYECKKLDLHKTFDRGATFRANGTFNSVNVAHSIFIILMLSRHERRYSRLAVSLSEDWSGLTGTKFGSINGIHTAHEVRLVLILLITGKLRKLCGRVPVLATLKKARAWQFGVVCCCPGLDYLCLSSGYQPGQQSQSTECYWDP